MEGTTTHRASDRSGSAAISGALGVAEETERLMCCLLFLSKVDSRGLAGWVCAVCGKLLASHRPRGPLNPATPIRGSPGEPFLLTLD